MATKKLKINFKQAKYIMPLIILPFFFFFLFIYNSWGGNKQEEPVATEGLHGMNTTLPTTSKEIDDGELKNKLDAFRQVYGRDKDLSALNGLGDLNEMDNGFESAYTTEDERALQQKIKYDSLLRSSQNLTNKDLAEIHKSLMMGGANAQSFGGGSSGLNGFGGMGSASGSVARNRMNANNNVLAMAGGNPQGYGGRGGNTGSGYGKNSEADEFTKKFGYLFDENGATAQAQGKQKNAPYGGYGSTTEEENVEEMQMRMFREQMRIVDSMDKANASKGNSAAANGLANSGTMGKNGINSQNFNPDNSKRNVLPVRAGIQTTGFNTVYANKKSYKAGIPAIIDQNVKGQAASRIRLKLMSDMWVGETLLKRGTYIYAFVSGFGTQRVMLSVKQIMHNNTPMDVDLDVFDNDGYVGLYVPGSLFREFTKQVGDQSTKGLSSITTSENNEMTKNLIQSLFTSAGTAASGLIKSNKADFKYNYVIYLKENASAKQ